MRIIKLLKAFFYLILPVGVIIFLLILPFKDPISKKVLFSALIVIQFVFYILISLLFVGILLSLLKRSLSNFRLFLAPDNKKEDN